MGMLTVPSPPVDPGAIDSLNWYEISPAIWQTWDLVHSSTHPCVGALGGRGEQLEQLSHGQHSYGALGRP